MSGSSIKFQKNGYEFAKQVLNNLKKINNPSSSIELYITCIDELQELLLTYIDYLPCHFIELLDFLEQLIYKKNLSDLSTIEGHAFLNRIQFLCELMCSPPSIDLYINLALHEFDCLYQYSDFSEEIVSCIIDYLIHNSDDSFFSKDIVSAFSKFDLSNEKRDLLWLSLSKVPISPMLQIKAIENVDLTGDKLLEFCREISISGAGNENVLLALVKKVNEETFSSYSNKDNEIKEMIFYYIVLCAIPPIPVVKKIIELINPSDDNYFNFFYMIIQEFAKKASPADKKIILSTILDKVTSDENSKKEDVKVQIRRLRLLAYNL